MEQILLQFLYADGALGTSGGKTAKGSRDSVRDSVNTELKGTDLKRNDLEIETWEKRKKDSQDISKASSALELSGMKIDDRINNKIKPLYTEILNSKLANSVDSFINTINKDLLASLNINVMKLVFGISFSKLCL